MNTEILRRPSFHIVLIVFLGLVVYSNTFDASFNFDDGKFIVQNPLIKDISYFFDMEKAEQKINELMLTEDILRYFKTRYVAYLSFWANYQTGGMDVTGYHVVNTAVHIVNALLVYMLVRLTFMTPFLVNSDSKANSRFIALFSGLLFVAHPIQTMAVTYILQRFASLAAMFYLLSIVLYVKWRLGTVRNSELRVRSKSAVAGSFLYYIAALLSCVLAMKTKELTFTLPLMIALYESLFFTTSHNSLDAVRTKKRGRRTLYLVPFFSTMLIISSSYIGLNVDAGGLLAILDGATDLPEESPPRLVYFLSQFGVITTYIRLLFMPIGQSMYYEDMVRHSFSEPGVFLPFLFLLGVFGFGGYCLVRSSGFGVRRRRQPSASHHLLRLTSFGIFWFFLALSVEASVLPISDVIDEYRVYLPSAGAFMAVISGALYLTDRFGNRGRKVAACAACVAVVVLSGATYARNTIWQSGISLWEDTVKKAPFESKGYFFLGKECEADGLMEKAIVAYKKCIELNPDVAGAYNNLGIAYTAISMTDLAIDQFSRALELDPFSPRLHINLGSVYIAKGMTDKAIEHYKSVLKIQPGYMEAYNNLGEAYMTIGMTVQAIEQYETALKFDPRLAEAYFNLGKAYLATGDVEKAEDQFRTALEVRPDDAGLQSDIGSAYLEAGDADKALEHFEVALELTPDNAVTHSNLAAAYQSKGMIDKTIEHYRAAAKFEPRNPINYYNLGIIYQSRGLTDNAIQLYQLALKVYPNYAGAHNNLGVAYKSKGMVDKAIEHYRTAIELVPDYAQAHFNLGLVYFQQGLKKEARGEFEAALRIDPGYVKARESLEELDKIK
jgi:tetratricopeptide (TPR) repeat protein